MSPWTLFNDMHSGGGTKHKYELIYIEAPYKEAIRVFYARFGTNPYRVSCTCCGADYSVTPYDETDDQIVDPKKDMQSASAYRARYWRNGEVLVIPATEISDDERNGPEPPAQGYVWAG